jgi:hypothetical protein
MNSELPIQVDGEPWIQCAGEIVVLKSALKVKAIFTKINLFFTSNINEVFI